MAKVFLLFLIILPLFIIPLGSGAVNRGDILINEIAWMGTIDSANDEWIELFNISSQAISIEGWILKSIDGTPEIKLKGSISANGFYLLERTDNSSLSTITADKIYTGAIGNDGEDLLLYDDSGNLIDRADFSSGWIFGNNDTKQTIERVNLTSWPASNDSRSDAGWQTSQDSGGTAKAKNSSGKVIVVKTNTQESEGLIKQGESDNRVSIKGASVSGPIDLSQEPDQGKNRENPWFLFLVAIAVIIVGAIIFVILKYGNIK